MSASQKPPAAFRRIELALAREQERPLREAARRLTLVAPLDERGRLDPHLWNTHRISCRVVRHHEDAEDEIGHLIRRPGGSWAVRYPGEQGEEDRAPRLGSAEFSPGAYVSITDGDDLHTFRVVSITAL